MIERILLAVDDSAGALAATRLAIELAAGLGAQLRAVHVLVDHEIDAVMQTGTGRPGLAGRRQRSAASVVARVSDLGATQGVSVETALLHGQVADAVLDEARRWRADLLVIGRSFRSSSGAPYVGSQARHLLEFADGPVLVVPRPHPEGLAHP